MYNEEEYLLLSGIQHFAFCRRQWALIHIEQQWSENLLTTEGEFLHEKAHDETFTEKRGDLIISRGMPVVSREMGISGTCDVVEFHRRTDGIPLFGRDGRYSLIPVEYKHGKPKSDEEDILQLTAQAMCLEEMFVCTVPFGYLYYGETKHRTKVDFSKDTRQTVKSMLCEMHEMFARGYTPKVKVTSKCRSCSVAGLCLPKLCKSKSAIQYLSEAVEEGGS